MNPLTGGCSQRSIFIGLLVCSLLSSNACWSRGDEKGANAPSTSSTDHALESLTASSNDSTRRIAEEEFSQILEIVMRLGDDDFSTRESASRSLVQIGLPAIGPLETVQQHPDRELRFRARRTLDVLKSMDFRRRLEAFSKDQDGTDGYGLPGWNIFAKEIGTESNARSLFVKMQKAERDTLRVLEQKNPNLIGETLFHRLTEIENASLASPRGLAFESIAAILFMNIVDQRLQAEQGPHSNNDFVSKSIFSLCYQESFRTVMSSGPYRPIARTMVGQWILGTDDKNASQAIYMAMEYDLDEGLHVARELIERGEVAADVKQFAVQALAKLGDDSDIEHLETALKDRTTISTRSVRDIVYTTQICDLALAALVHLTKQKYHEFGLDHIRPSETMVFSTASVGFASHEDREASIRKWRESRNRGLTN